jgi:DNA-3-methyladenine glycosylase II
MLRLADVQLQSDNGATFDSESVERGHLKLTAAEGERESKGDVVEGGSGDLSRGDFRIYPKPPFRLDLSVWALRRRSGNTIDRWDGTSYRRALALTETPVELSVTRAASAENPTLAVAFTGGRIGHLLDEEVRSSIERMIGLQVDLSSFYRMAAGDTLIGPLVERFRGLKPPRFPTVFESLLNAVSCQQLSLEAGLTLLNRLAETYGPAVSADQTSLHALPRADELAGLESHALRELGYSLRKAETVIDLARAVVDGRFDVEGIEDLADDEVIARLTGLKGIGRWSAEYVLLRGLGRLHVFPGDDVGARNNLARWLGVEPPLDYNAVRHAVSPWWPFAGMVYFHLLLEKLADVGELGDESAAGWRGRSSNVRGRR